jgi:hypothetical protein
MHRSAPRLRGGRISRQAHGSFVYQQRGGCITRLANTCLVGWLLGECITYLVSGSCLTYARDGCFICSDWGSFVNWLHRVQSW